MLALIYLALPFCLDIFSVVDFFGFCFSPNPHALAFLVGLAFARFWRPLLWGDALFFVTAIAVLTWPRWKRKILKPKENEAENAPTASLYLPRPKGSNWADWALIVA